MAGSGLTLTLDASDFDLKIDKIEALLQNMRPVYDEIGYMIKSDIDLLFRDQQDPKGKAWEPLSDVTLLRRRKQGIGARILQDTGQLKASITYNVMANGVEIGTNKVYGAMMNFGGEKSQFPHLWGDIPARQFIPDADDIIRNNSDEIAEIVFDFIRANL